MEDFTQTESVCPVCLQRIPATRVFDEQDVYLQKTCPQHGSFRTILWRGIPPFKSWRRPKTPSFPANPLVSDDLGCPYDCGLCTHHRQHTCSVLLEVTQRCDLRCPVCFADAGQTDQADWTMEEIGFWYRRLLEMGGPFNIQISGGEPCVRDDLPQIIRLGRSFGFSYFQVNTNGLRLARDPRYLSELKAAGLSTVFLQFDAVRDDSYRIIRGRNLLEEKLKAIEQCKQAGVGVVLVPTLIPGVNADQIGGILKLAVSLIPTVRGVHFQPVSYFGRYPQPPDNSSRMTLPEIMRSIQEQSAGLFQTGMFSPPGCENALCSFHANFVQMPDGELKSLNAQPSVCNCTPIIAAEGAARSRRFVAENWSMAPEKTALRLAESPSFGDWDLFLERKRSHPFCISGMAFQDAWNLDLERLKDCCIHVAAPDGRLVPFCAYNLTSSRGESLYRIPVLSAGGSP
jgi:uncharacterized radical SAM superfamily Fe-S cluster-containing enzyme